MTTTLYNILLNVSGLSITRAADFHGVRTDTVKGWLAGRREIPPMVIQEIHEYLGKQWVSAQEFAALITAKAAKYPDKRLEVYINAKDGFITMAIFGKALMLMSPEIVSRIIIRNMPVNLMPDDPASIGINFTPR